MKKSIGVLLCLIFMGMGNTFAKSIEQDTVDYFDMSLEDLMNLEIVAVSKKAESSFDAPLSSSIITKDEIINSGATTIEEAFRLVPGFIVREETNGNYDIHVRGNDNVPPGNFTFFSENSMSLIMVDGRKVFNNLNGGTLWESLPVSITDVERIEIIRGASTALYGPNAVTGVVNIITKKSPDKTIAVDGNIQGGSANTLIGDFAVNTSSADNKFKARVSANYEKRDRFTEDYYGYTTGKYGHYTDLVDYMTGGSVSEGARTYAERELAKDRSGINASLMYDVNDNINFHVSGGLQNSKANTVFMETSVTPLSFRESESYFFNTISQIYGFNLQVAGNFGTQDINTGTSIGTKFDFQHLDFIAEYDFNFGNLTLRPGLSYQDIIYTDLPYATDKVGNGLLNAETELSNFAYYLRGDYKATEKLRLIAALRVDHYNKPSEDYFTYQFIGTYKPSKNHLIRASYAKANRGPVMIDSYTSFIDGSPESGSVFEYIGNDHMKLPTSHVFELGYRGQLSSKLQLDLEGFYSVTENFPSFEPHVETPTPEQPYVHVFFKYDNIPAKVAQTGATASLLYAPNTKLKVRAFATVQKTELQDHDKKVTPMIIDPGSMTFLNPTYQTTTETHEQTPTYFGGITANYTPMSKLNIFAGLNFVGEQTYRHDYSVSQMHMIVGPAMDPNYMGSGTATVEAQTNVNAKISYKVYKNNSVFVNARNLFGTSKPEFGFADQRAALFLVGANINL